MYCCILLQSPIARVNNPKVLAASKKISTNRENNAKTTNGGEGYRESTMEVKVKVNFGARWGWLAPRPKYDGQGRVPDGGESI